VELLLDEFSELSEERATWRDPFFLVPYLAQLKEIVIRNSVKDIPSRPNRNECEEYALYLLADIRRDSQLMNNPYNLAMGIADGFQYSDMMGWGAHTLNIALTHDSGIVITEPQTDVITVSDINVFSAYYIWA